MNTKRLRKIFLPSVILLFSVLVLGQSAWACDEPDYGCYQQLDIKGVNVDFDKIYIWGKNFTNAGSPEVTVGDIPVRVIWYDDEWIEAQLQSDIPYGQYKLRVSTGNERNCKDKHSVTIPHYQKPSCEPTCPEKCPEPCPSTCTCPPEACKCSDAQCTCPAGSCQCLAGKLVSKRVNSTGITEPNSNCIGTYCTDFKDQVLCNDTGICPDGITPCSTTISCPNNGSCTFDTGYTVTGGGFLAKDLTIIESYPLSDGTGWHVVGTTAPFVAKYELSPSLQVWAVCVKVQ